MVRQTAGCMWAKPKGACAPDRKLLALHITGCYGATCYMRPCLQCNGITRIFRVVSGGLGHFLLGLREARRKFYIDVNRFTLKMVSVLCEFCIMRTFFFALESNIGVISGSAMGTSET